MITVLHLVGFELASTNNLRTNARKKQLSECVRVSISFVLLHCEMFYIKQQMSVLIVFLLNENNMVVVKKCENLSHSFG